MSGTNSSVVCVKVSGTFITPGDLVALAPAAGFTVGKLSGFTYCFAAGTLVATEDGQTPIERVQAGQRVWSCDLTTGQWHLCRVEETYAFEHRDSLLEVFVAGHKIESTYHHPYWVVEGHDFADRPTPDHVALAAVRNATVSGRWVDAGDLQVGYVLLLMDGRRLAVEEILARRVHETVYNCAVANLHNYAVGPDRVLAHNICAAASSSPQRFEQITKHKPGGSGSLGLLDDAQAARAVNQAAVIKPGMRAIELLDGTVAIFRSASKKPGTFGFDLWHGGWQANAAELLEIGNIILPKFLP